jgi:hypothetical protein
MAIVVNKPLPEFEANATGGIKVSKLILERQGLLLFGFGDQFFGSLWRICFKFDFL